jgi:hypothetical protein
MDPIGYPIQGSPTAVGGLTVGGVPILPRRTSSQITSLQAAIRFCTMMDDIAFGTNGLAGFPAQRAGRFNAAFLIQRSKNNVRQEINLKVVVYQNRPLDTPLGETVIGSTNVTPSTDLISISNAGGVPRLRKGSWILLANQAAGTAEAFADFYRVVGFSESSTTMNVSVSPPIRDHNVSYGNAYGAYVMVLDNVVEVFDRGTITPFAVPGR